MDDTMDIPIDGELHAKFKAAVAWRRDGSMKQVMEGLIINYIDSIGGEPWSGDPNEAK